MSIDQQSLVKKFITENHSLIEGWFFPADWQAFILLYNIQVQLGSTGDICEIGVYQGKSAALLSLLRQTGEKLLCFDFFEEKLNGGEDIVRKNLANFGDAEHVDMIKGDTAKLSKSKLKSLIETPLRFLHIDAGHEYYEVLEQLRQFAPFLNETAIVAMDDTEDREFPGVSEAVFEFCRDRNVRDLVPFYVGANKKYLCMRHVASTFQKELLQAPQLMDNCRITRLKGHNLLIGHSKMPLPNTTVLKQINDSDFPFYDDLTLSTEERTAKYSQLKYSGKLK